MKKNLTSAHCIIIANSLKLNQGSRKVGKGSLRPFPAPARKHQYCMDYTNHTMASRFMIVVI